PNTLCYTLSLHDALPIFVWLFIFTSCLKVDCEENSKAFREYECLQIFERLPILESPYMESEGKHLLTGEDCVCKYRWLNNYKQLLEKGDAIIKRKGELTFSIHKRDTIIVVKWECEGKIYE